MKKQEASQHDFSVVLEPQEGGGFTALVPALPEVVTEGKTKEEALAMAEEAISRLLKNSDAKPNHAT